MSISTIENFIPDDLVSALEETLCGKEFPWFWRSSTTYGEYEEGEGHKDFQFIHLVYFNNEVKSNIFDLVVPILIEFEAQTGMQIKQLDKIKANLTTQSWLTEEELETAKHIDVVEGRGKFLTIVYYVTDSDGDTIIYASDEQEVIRKAPVKGTAVYFPSTELHRHTPPKEHKRRIVLNIVVELE